MTKQTPETPSNIEIGSFKTPEELAEALEAKSKIDLAKRIRIISGQVQDTSTDLRQRLQDELTPQEHGEIRETLQNSGVATVFTKGLSGEEKAIQVAQKEMAGIIGEENTKSIQKVEGIWNRLSTGFDKIGDIFSEKGMVAGIGAIILMFKGIFSGDFSQLDELLDPKKSEKKAENAQEVPTSKNENVDEKTKGALYIAGTKLLLGFSKHKTDISYSILQNKKIKTLTYEQLSVDNLEKNGLGEKYGLPGKDNEIYETLSILKERQDFINTTLGKKFPNWKQELKLEEIILEYGKYGKVFDQIRGISLNDLKSLKLPDNLFSFNKDNSGSLDEILNERLQSNTSKLKGVHKGFLITLYSSKESNFDADLINGYPNSNKEFVKDYIEFRNKVPAFISGSFFHGNPSAKEKFGQYFNNFSFTHKDILDLYIITDGELNFEKLNDFQHGLIFLKVFDLLGKDNSGLRGETYLFAIREILEGKSNEITNKIPQSVKETFLNIAKETGETVMQGAVGFLKDLWGALNNNQKLSVAALSITYLIGMVYLGRAIFAGKALGIGFVGGLGVLTTSKIYSYLSEDPKTKEILEKYKIKDGNDLSKEFEKIKI
ncbi:MAG: hypothetical protein AB7E37_01830 [Candidatus Altimarinota bacterium]